MNFKEYFLEANIQRLSPQEEEQTDRITDEINRYSRDPKVLKRKAISKDGYTLVLVSKLRYERRDLKTPSRRSKELPVYIKLSPDNDTNGAFVPHRSPEDDYIYIDYDFLKTNSRVSIKSLLSHEIIHAVQHYRKMSDLYKKAVRKTATDMTFLDWVNYYAEPLEKEAIFSEIDTVLSERYKQLVPVSVSNPVTIQYLNKQREKFLLELTLFATTPLENYIVNQELPIPDSLLKFDQFFATLLQRNVDTKEIQTLPPSAVLKLKGLRREFKTKLLNILQKIEERENLLENPPST